MSLLETIYIGKYKTLMNKIDELNKKNVAGYKTFREYVLADEIMISYFEELKKLENKFGKLWVEDNWDFRDKLLKQLKSMYNKKLVEIYETKAEAERKESLNTLKLEINNSFGHGCDNELHSILNDLESKIKNPDAYKVENITSELVDEDPLMKEVLEFIAKTNLVSAQLLQRKFNIGYERANRIIDALEENDCIGPMNGSKPREVMVNENNVSEAINKKILVEIPKEEQYNKILEKSREGKSIQDIMKEYNIEVEYGEKNPFDSITNSLILNSIEDDDKEELINYFIKYMHAEKLKLALTCGEQPTFNNYIGLPHLLCPIAQGVNKTNVLIQKICIELDRRYDVLYETITKSIEGFNDFVEKYNKKHPDKIKKKLPYILVIVSEFSDILKDNYQNLTKILMNGRKVGIKVIIFTKFKKRQIEVESMEDLLNIYNKYNLVSIIKGEKDLLDDINKIDAEMDGFDFENYAAELLKANGFERVKVTQASGDYGVDIIAYKDEIKYSIQCKKYSSPVGIKAVQEVIGSKVMNDCHVAAVLTNNDFTKSAVELAKKNNVLLWGRDKLEEFIENYNK